MNIRPDCDCIARDGEVQADIKAYLLKGSKITNTKVVERLSGKYGLMSESDTESVVFGMTGGATVSFQFAERSVEPSGPWIPDRIGRLLPPYLTRLQQRYSAYLQRPGLSKVPKAAWPIVPVAPAPVVSAPAPVPVMAPVAAKKVVKKAVKKTAPKKGGNPQSPKPKAPKR